MEPNYLRSLLPQMLEDMYPGQSFSVGPDNAERDPFGWGFRGDGDAASTITTLNVGDELGGILRITSGVASDVPVSAAACLHETMSRVNAEIYFGRAWATLQGEEGGRMLALMQVIVPLAFLSETHLPSLQFLGTLIEGVSQAAAKATAQVLSNCGGELHLNAFAILMSG